jgi:hypothetical protein
MIEASKIKKCPTCGITKRKHGNRSTQTWWNHISACLKYQKKYKAGCNCGKVEADFKTKSAFLVHTTYCGVKGHPPARPSKNHPATVAAKEIGTECNCGKTATDFQSKYAFSGHVRHCGRAQKPKRQVSERKTKNEATKLLKMSIGDLREHADKIGYDVARGAKKEPLLRVLFSDHFKFDDQAIEGLLAQNPDRKHPAAIKTRHVKVSKPFKCSECGKEFATKGQVKHHSWVHKKPEAGKEWGDKDAIRRSLQTIAAARLQRLPLNKRVAICLPGNRPEHEQELLDDPGFSRIHMVECVEDRCIAATKKGFDVEHGDFLDTMMDLVNQGTHLALIDYDLCGTLSYADGSKILEAIRLGGLADIAAVRVTCCRRNYKRSGEIDIAALDQDILHALPLGYGITGKSWNFYVGKDRSSMATQQWLIEKGA